MFIFAPRRFRKTKMIRIKENVPIKIEQSVAVTLDFPCFYDYKDTLIHGYCCSVQSRYVPKRKYGFQFKSTVTGENCRPLRGEELYNNAIEQNRSDYDKCISDIIEIYKRETGVTKIDYQLDKYENGFADTIYRTIEYDKEVEI